MPLELVDAKQRRNFCKTFIFDIQKKNSYSTFYFDSKQRAGGAGIIN